MNPIRLILQLFVLLSMFACNNKSNENEFDKTESLKITYTINREHKVLTVSDEKKVKEITRSLAIKSTEKGVHFGIDPFGTVEFTLKGGAVIEVFFVRPKTLEGDQGRIDLKNADFYDKINKVLSEKEGKRIDVLIDN